MPPTRKFTKEEIVEVAYKIVEKEGLENLNARAVAAEVGSSVQPIFHNFASMKELESAVYDKIYDKYVEYLMKGKDDVDGYRKMGLGYIKFAKDYPNFFKILFMQKTSFDIEKFMLHDAFSDDIIEVGRKFTHFTYEEQKKFHTKVWLFTHGVACLLSTGTVSFTDDELVELLTSTVKSMVLGFQIEEEKKHEKDN